MLRAFTIFLIMSCAAQMSAQSTQRDTSVSSYPHLLELTHGHVIDDVLHSIDRSKRTSVEVFSPFLGHTAFFCKMEDKLKKSSKLPVKFRLGDVEYVDQYEGKGLKTHIPTKDFP